MTMPRWPSAPWCEQYPQSRKAPDALLKLGYTQYELKHLSDARATLEQVVQRYPGSDAAKLAASG